MDFITITEIAQRSEIPKSIGFLLLLEIFEQKQTCPACLYIMSIQPQHYTTWQGCSTGGLAVSHHTFDKNCVVRPLPFLESLAQVWHKLVFSSFPWRTTCFCRSCVGLLKPAKQKIKTEVSKKFNLFQRCNVHFDTLKSYLRWAADE